MMLVKDPWDDLKQKQVCVERKPQKTKWQDKQYVYIYIYILYMCVSKEIPIKIQHYETTCLFRAEITRTRSTAVNF